MVRPSVTSRALVLTAFALAATVFGVYALVLYDVLKERPATYQDDVTPSRFSMLVACSRGDFAMPFLPAICQSFLENGRLTQTEIAEINRRGAVGELSELDQSVARTILGVLVAQGVDLNAIPETPIAQLHRWTLLHTSSTTTSWWVGLLLEYGARSDLQDKDGNTATDRVKAYTVAQPTDAEAAKILRLLMKTDPQK